MTISKKIKYTGISLVLIVLVGLLCLPAFNRVCAGFAGFSEGNNMREIYMGIIAYHQDYGIWLSSENDILKYMGSEIPEKTFTSWVGKGMGIPKPHFIIFPDNFLNDTKGGNKIVMITNPSITCSRFDMVVLYQDNNFKFIKK